MHNLVFFSGSSRKSTVNGRLALSAAELARETYGSNINVSMIDLSEFDIPTFEGSSEPPDSLPGDVNKLLMVLKTSSGLFISSDEYTGAFSAQLRNLIGWLTSGIEKNDSVFYRKLVVLCGVSPHGVGGLRGQPALHLLLKTVGANVHSQFLALGTSSTAFDKNNELLPRIKTQLIEGPLAELADFQST